MKKLLPIALFGLMLCVASCSKEDSSVVTTYFTYSNQSGTDVTLISYSDSVLRNNVMIPPSIDTFRIANGQTLADTVWSEVGFVPPFLCDSIRVVFGNHKAKTYYWGRSNPRSPLLIDGYTETVLDDTHSRLDYVFTLSDWNAADSLR
jgi:hypothetical protein